MRIIAGTHRGRRIAAPKGMATRPTGDRVREAVFNLIGPVDGATVLDLFAGSGAMGLEALSRGARHCVFVDSDRGVAQVIRANLDSLELTDASILARDAIDVLRQEGAAGRLYDLVLVDPPYADWAGLEPRHVDALPQVLEGDGRVVVETAARTEPHLGLDLVTSRRYGSARISVFSR